MSQVKIARRPVDGVLLLDKPAGISSNKALQRIRWLLKAEKGGHTGNLDPLAEGVLPLCFGNATKYATYGLDANKTYLTRIRLGEQRDTGDAEGAVIKRCPVPALQQADVTLVLQQMLGMQQQIPPMYSALKHQGQKLYDLARAGRQVERQPRAIELFSITLLELTRDSLLLEVDCSKGTYIRVLGEDIASALGSCGHLSYLRRIRSGCVDASQLVTLPQVEAAWDSGGEAAVEQLLLPVDYLIRHLPAVHLSAAEAAQITHGQALKRLDLTSRIGENVRLFSGEAFIGLGQVREGDARADCVLVPCKLLRQP